MTLFYLLEKMTFASALTLVTFLFITNTIPLVMGASALREERAPLPHSYEVSLRFANRHFCGGAIIGPRHVVTAAHCFYQAGKKYPEPMYRYMSVVSGFNANLAEGGHSHRIKNVTSHEDLRNATKDYWINDIALITLEDDIAYSALEQPIDLPDKDIGDAVRAKMSLWYSPVDALLSVEVFLMPHGKCMEKLKEKFLGEHYSKVCGYTRTGRGFCLNNRGSPLVQNEKLIGVASASEGCVNGNPDVYTNVYRNLDFINRAIAQSAAI